MRLHTLVVPLLVISLGLLASCASKAPPKGATPDAVSGPSAVAASGEDGKSIRDELEPIEGKRVLVVYFSQGAATARVAEDLAALTGGDLELIVEEKPRSQGFFGFMNAGRQATFGEASRIKAPAKDPQAYEAAIVLTPVWSWNLSPPVRAWLRLMKGKLPERTAFATVSGDTEPDKIVATMEKEGGRKAQAFAGFSERDFLPENRPGYLAKIAKLTAMLR